MLISDVYIYIYINYTISGEACARYAIGRTQGALKYTARWAPLWHVVTRLWPLGGAPGTWCMYLLGGWPTPLKNDGVKVSWDCDIPNWMESHRIPWFQTTNQISYKSFNPPEKWWSSSDWIIIPTIGENKIPWFQTTNQISSSGWETQFLAPTGWLPISAAVLVQLAVLQTPRRTGTVTLSLENHGRIEFQ